MAEKDRFAIISQGRTASYWFAAALDAHPEISCGHSKQNPPIPDYRGKGSGRTLDDVVSGIEVLPTAPNEYYDLLEKCGDGPQYGTVHAYSVGQAAMLNDAGIKSALLTRNPIARCDSMADRSKIEMEQSATVVNRIRDGVEQNLGRFEGGRAALEKVDEIEWLPFVAACFDISHEAGFLDRYPFVLQSERITSDPDYMTWFLYNFLGLTVSSEYLDDVYSRGNLNSLSGLRKSAFSIFQNWPDWKKETFSIFNDKYGIKRFSEHGYDVEGTIKANRHDNAWRNRDAEGEAALGSSQFVIRNLGKNCVSEVRAGTAVDIYVRINSTKLAVRLGDKQNDTELLHQNLPEDTRKVRISFSAPIEPGTYQLQVSEGSSKRRWKLGKSGVLIDMPIKVVPAGMNLSDHGLLRASITAVA